MISSTAAHGGNDLLPAYLAVKGQAAPIVYFDSRTYGVVVAGSADLSTPNTYNGFLAQDVGGIRPYKTEVTIEPPPAGGYTGTNKAKEDAAFAAFKFHNPDTFQIISPGLDGSVRIDRFHVAGKPCCNSDHSLRDRNRQTRSAIGIGNFCQ